MKRLVLESNFFIRFGSGGLHVDWVAEATHWPADESGDAHWDVDVSEVYLSVLGFGIVSPDTLTLDDIETKLAEHIAERTEEEAQIELREKLRTANPVDFIKWPTEVDF